MHVYLTVKLPLRNAQGEVIGLCGISTDISEHKQNQAQIHRLAFYDALTGLPNRRLLQERLQHALAQQQRSGLEGALLFIDLDHFKNINDTLGHAVGDQLLMQVAQRLSSCLRQGDTLARLGGDEFVLMLENLPRERSRALAEIGTVANKLLGTLNQPYELLGQPRSSGASIGIALFSDAAGNPEDLLKRADLAMYEAKSGGRNTLRFSIRTCRPSCSPAPSWKPTCAAAWPRASSSCTTRRRSMCKVGWSAPKPWRAGSTRSRGW